jgi:hypothetical protein
MPDARAAAAGGFDARDQQHAWRGRALKPTSRTTFLISETSLLYIADNSFKLD